MGENSRVQFRKRFGAMSRSDELRAALIDEVRVLVDQSGASDAAILAALSTLSLEVTTDAINLNVDDLERSNIAIEVAVELIRDRTTPKNKLYRLQNEAEDTVETYTFLDAGLADERIDTIVYSSTALSISATETYVFSGSSPNFFLSTITVS